MAPADWTTHEKELGNVVVGGLDYDTWLAQRWPQEIGRYYTVCTFAGQQLRYFANRDAAGNNRPRAQRKTKEQVELLEYGFAKTFGYPSTGEMLALSFLAGLEPKKVKTWFDNERRKRARDEGDLSVETPESLGLEDQGLHCARDITFQYDQDPRGYARKLVFGKLCVRTGSCGPKEALQRPRPYLKKYWRRMFPGEGDERTLEDVSRELAEDSDDNSIDSEDAGIGPSYPMLTEAQKALFNKQYTGISVLDEAIQLS